MDSKEKLVTINLSCESDTEYADALISIFNKKLLCVEKKLEKSKIALDLEKTSHSKVISALEIAQRDLGKYQGLLEVEQGEHAKVLADLEVEKTEHGKTCDALEAEKTEHGKTRDAFEAEKTEHGKTRDALEAEKTEHGKTRDAFEAEKTEHDKTREALEAQKIEHGKTRDALEAEKTEHGKTRDAFETEKIEHDKTREALEAQKIEHAKTQEALECCQSKLDEVQNRLNIVDNSILSQIKMRFNEIASLLSVDFENLTEKSMELKKYIDGILSKDEEGNYGWSNATNLDDLVYSFKYGDNYLSRILNIIWWSRQESLYYMTSCIPNIDKIVRQVDFINEILSIEGHSINIPDSTLRKDIDNYEKYNDGKSHFMKIFDEQYENGTLCEIYLSSIDGNKGKCYIYWK